jgi:hypothetical protein
MEKWQSGRLVMRMDGRLQAPTNTWVCEQYMSCVCVVNAMVCIHNECMVSGSVFLRRVDVEQHARADDRRR